MNKFNGFLGVMALGVIGLCFSSAPVIAQDDASDDDIALLVANDQAYAPEALAFELRAGPHVLVPVSSDFISAFEFSRPIAVSGGSDLIVQPEPGASGRWAPDCATTWRAKTWSAVYALNGRVLVCPTDSGPAIRNQARKRDTRFALLNLLNKPQHSKLAFFQNG